ncbi:MAG TPA: FtsX-like permease family protein [Baekduia sp.]|nr:FtsX-like permease family protein [Baekduia sp.]
MSLTAWGLGTTKPGRLRLSSALALYGVRLRKRWVQELLAVLGIAAGVALLYATQVASTSLSGPVQSINQGLVGNSQLQLLSRGSAAFPEQTYELVMALPGVRRAAPALQVPGNLVGRHGERGVTFFGADPRIVKLRGTLLQGFSSSDAAQQETLVLPSPMARAIGAKVGDDVGVELAGRSVTVPVVVAGRDQIGSLVDTSIALVPLAYLQRLAGIGQGVTRILVEARPGEVSNVRRGLQRIAAGHADVRPADYESRLFDESAKPTSQASTIFSVLSALVGWLFAVCALLVTATERRKLAVQQHDQGYPPSATLMTLLVDAAVIAIVGVAAGLAAGELLSRRGFESDISFLSGAFPIGDLRIVTWQSIAIAGVGGLLATVVGVLAPVRGVVVASLPRQLRPALSRTTGAEGAPPRPAGRGALPALGAACLAAAVAITIAAPGTAVVGLVLLAIALVTLLPAILAGAVTVLEWINRRGKRSLVAVELALQQLRARQWRTRALAIAATGAIAVFGATALEGARANLQTGLEDVVRGLDAAAAVWATPAGAGSVYGTATFPPSATQALARLPAIRSVGLYRAGLIDIDNRRAWVVGTPRDAEQAIPRHQILEGDMERATSRIRAGGWATVSRALADDLGLHIGQRFTLPARTPTVLRVAAITTNLGWSAGAILMNATDFARSWADDAVAAYHLRVAPGTSAAEARQQVADALGPRSPLRVETAAQRGDRQLTSALKGLSRLRQIAGLTLLAAILAMTAAMTGLLWQHRPIVAGLKLHGLRAGLMWRSLVIETGVLFSTGALAGGMFGLLGQVLCTRGVQVVTGFPVVEGLRLDVASATVGLVVGASLLAVIVPGYMVARVRPS